MSHYTAASAREQAALCDWLLNAVVAMGEEAEREAAGLANDPAPRRAREAFAAIRACQARSLRRWADAWRLAAEQIEEEQGS